MLDLHSSTGNLFGHFELVIKVVSTNGVVKKIVIDRIVRVGRACDQDHREVLTVSTTDTIEGGESANAECKYYGSHTFSVKFGYLEELMVMTLG